MSSTQTTSTQTTSTQATSTQATSTPATTSTMSPSSDTALSTEPSLFPDPATRMMDSPVGLLKLVAEPDALTGVYFATSKSVENFPDRTEHQYDILDTAQTQLEEYFRGERQEFDIPLNAHGTPFQLSVWSLLQEIPFGVTSSYGRLASALGDPNKSRAVGLANGSNPISIIVPCHRVVGSDGSLTGFGGGLPAKRWLLIHEGASLQSVDVGSSQFSLPF